MQSSNFHCFPPEVIFFCKQSAARDFESNKTSTHFELSMTLLGFTPAVSKIVSTILIVSCLVDKFVILTKLLETIVHSSVTESLLLDDTRLELEDPRGTVCTQGDWSRLTDRLDFFASNDFHGMCR